MFVNDGGSRTWEGGLESGIFRSVLADLAGRKIPDFIPGSEIRPAMVIFAKGRFSTARVYFGRLSPAARLELILAAHAINVIRMDADTDQTRMVVPSCAENLISMFCAVWLTFARARADAREWSLHAITALYPDVTATPAFAATIRVFGRLVLGQENLQLPDGVNVRFPGAALS